jgi:cytochrome c oxidase assembly protein subunit 11
MKVLRLSPAAVRDAALEREVVISFNSDVATGLPWRFTPTQRSVRVKPGETTLAFFTAKNLSNVDITGVATYNVQPNKAGVYFNKVQCFCFEEQRLRAGEEVDMPVFFYLDPEFATDASVAGPLTPRRPHC